MKKRILLFIFTVTVMISLSACGSATFDAAGYVKACLDAAYHEEFEAYAEFIDCTVDEAKAELDRQRQAAIKAELDTLDVTVTDEQAEEYLSMLLKLENLTKYDVGKAVKKEEGFEVTVTVCPLNVYEQFMTGIEGAYQKVADTGELTQETIFPVMLDYLEECIASIEYKDAVETTIHVTKNSDDVWQISEEEMYAIDDLLLPGI